MKAYRLLIISLLAGTLICSAPAYAELKQSEYHSSYSAQALYDQLGRALAHYKAITEHCNNAQLLTPQNLIKQQEYDLAIDWFTKHIRSIIDSYTQLDDDNSVEADRQKIFTTIVHNITLIEELNAAADKAFTMLLIYSSNAPLTHQKYRTLHQAMTDVLAEETEHLHKKRALLIHGHDQDTINKLTPCSWRHTLIQKITINNSWFFSPQNTDHTILIDQAQRFPLALYYAYRSFLTLWYNRHKQYDCYRLAKESLLQELQALSTQLFIHHKPETVWLQEMTNRLITHVITLGKDDHLLTELQVNEGTQNSLQRLAIEYSHFCTHSKSFQLYNDEHWLLIQEFRSCMEAFFKLINTGNANTLLSRFYYIELELEQRCQDYSRSFWHRLFAGEHPLKKTFITMHALTTTCINHLQEKIHPQSSLLSTLLSGTWLLPEKIQAAASGKEGTLAMNVAQQVLASNITGSNTSTLQIVSLAAPPIAVGLMHYFMPSLSKQVQQTIKGSLASYAKSWKVDKLLQFFNNHPEVEQECRTVNQHLFSKLEEQVETIKPEEGRLDSV